MRNSPLHSFKHTFLIFLFLQRKSFLFSCCTSILAVNLMSGVRSLFEMRIASVWLLSSPSYIVLDLWLVWFLNLCLSLSSCPIYLSFSLQLWLSSLSRLVALHTCSFLLSLSVFSLSSQNSCTLPSLCFSLSLSVCLVSLRLLLPLYLCLLFLSQKPSGQKKLPLSGLFSLPLAKSVNFSVRLSDL